jgi:hypothetical protein
VQNALQWCQPVCVGVGFSKQLSAAGDVAGLKHLSIACSDYLGEALLNNKDYKQAPTNSIRRSLDRDHALHHLQMASRQSKKRKPSVKSTYNRQTVDLAPGRSKQIHLSGIPTLRQLHKCQLLQNAKGNVVRWTTSQEHVVEAQ